MVSGAGHLWLAETTNWRGGGGSGDRTQGQQRIERDDRMPGIVQVSTVKCVVIGDGAVGKVGWERGGRRGGAGWQLTMARFPHLDMSADFLRQGRFSPGLCSNRTVLRAGRDVLELSPSAD